MLAIETVSASCTPPMQCWSPYGSTMTLPPIAQCLSKERQSPLFMDVHTMGGPLAAADVAGAISPISEGH